MKFEFKKSKYPIIKICSWLLVFLFILQIIMFVKINHYKITSKGIIQIKPISFNVKFNRKLNDIFFVCVDDYCKSLEDNSITGNQTGLANIKNAQFDFLDKTYNKVKTQNIYFAIPKDLKNSANLINNIVLYVKDSAYHLKFRDIIEFESKTLPIILDSTGEKKDYKIYSLNLPEMKEDQNILADFILNDYQNYKDYQIIAFSTSKEKPDELKDSNVLWKYTDKKLTTLEKYPKKTILYFDLNSADIDILSIHHAKIKIYNTNQGKIAKLVYN